MTVASPYETTRYLLTVTNANGCTDTSSVLVTVESSALSIDMRSLRDSTLQFPESSVGSIICRTITLHNNGDGPIVFGEFRLRGNGLFSIPPSQLPVLINPHDTANLEILLLMQFDRRCS